MEAQDVLLMNVALTWALVGLIWTVQLVQYPGFAQVGRHEFGRYHAHHCARMGWVVAPLMVGELATSGWLLLERPEGLTAESATFGFALVLLVWAMTGAVFVPLHGSLGRPNPKLLRRLVGSNWVRTAAWSARGVWGFLVLRGWNA